MSAADRAFRISLIAAFAVGGFFFTPLFIGAAFVAWSMLRGTGEPRPPEGDPRGRADPRAGVSSDVTSATPDWQTRFMAECDSPAEEAFLTAMIRGCKLVPEDGRLRGPAITLRMQVQAWYYRLDFLVDDWLIVEIDGATYHSSSEAKRHDGRRDAFLADRGYTTLRIPASTVFQAPDEAVNSVRLRACAGNPKLRPCKSVWQEVGGAVGAINKVFEHSAVAMLI